MDWLKDMTWLHHLNKAVTYIEAHLEGNVSIPEAARTACCSTYYFQRVFSYVAGVPVAEYIRRRRMSKAGAELQQAGSKVVDVALKYGYSSPTAFNRAFQSVYGMSPAAAKRAGIRLAVYPRLQFPAKDGGTGSLSCRIVRTEAIRVVGVRTPMWEDMERNMKSVPLFWEQVLQDGTFAEICSLSGFGSSSGPYSLPDSGSPSGSYSLPDSGSPSGPYSLPDSGSLSGSYSLPDSGSPSGTFPCGILGVSVYRNPQDIFYYIAAATNLPAPPDLYELVIPPAAWAVFENEGVPREDVQNTFRRFWSEWLPCSGYEYAWLPDIEVYPVCEGKQETGHSEVWIALKE